MLIINCGPLNNKDILRLMTLTKKKWNTDFFDFFYFENKALGSFQSASGVHFKVSRGSIESASIRVNLMHQQMNHGALSIEPKLTLKWPPEALWNEPSLLF